MVQQGLLGLARSSSSYRDAGRPHHTLTITPVLAEHLQSRQVRTTRCLKERALDVHSCRLLRCPCSLYNMLQFNDAMGSDCDIIASVHTIL